VKIQSDNYKEPNVDKIKKHIFNIEDYADLAYSFSEVINYTGISYKKGDCNDEKMD